MTCTLRWTAPPRVSSFHAADAVRRGLPLSDAAVGEALAAPVTRLDAALHQMGVDASDFWDVAPALAARTETAAELAAAFIDIRSRDIAPANRDALTSCIADLELAAHRLWPGLAEELALRERPIREQWEARGPGMLRRMLDLAGADFTIPPAEVALMQPCLGGGGETHARFSLVRLEAVLTNSWPALPEPVRLGWLLFRLAAEQAEHEPVCGYRQIALATIPLALEAAKYVEWAVSDGSTLELALHAWRPWLPAGTVPDD